MPINFHKFITRGMVKGAPRALFVFGDNMYRTGLGGQAREMRGEPNAVGLITKRRPSHSFVTDYLTDDMLEQVMGLNDKDVGRLVQHLINRGIVIWPEDGIGTGLAKLEEYAPKVLDYYERLLQGLLML